MCLLSVMTAQMTGMSDREDLDFIWYFREVTNVSIQALTKKETPSNNSE